MTRAERHKQVTTMLDEGLTRRQISERLDLSYSMVCEVIADPSGDNARARKHKRHGTCVDCGTPTHSGGSVKLPERCHRCARLRSRDIDVRREVAARPKPKVWGDVECIEAIQRAATDGVCSTAAYKAARVPGYAPSIPTLVNRFGSWRNAVHAAGLQLEREEVPEEYACRIDDEVMLEAVRRCADELGYAPGSRVYDDWARDRGVPCCAYIRQRFGGSWVRVIEAAMQAHAA